MKDAPERRVIAEILDEDGRTVEKVYASDETPISQKERIERSWESGGHAVQIREAKLYYTALRKAYDAEESDGSPAECWRIGDKFIAKHEDGTDERGFRAPPHPARGGFLSQFYAVWGEAQPGDAKETYERLMAERFGPRPDR